VTQSRRPRADAGLWDAIASYCRLLVPVADPIQELDTMMFIRSSAELLINSNPPSMQTKAKSGCRDAKNSERSDCLGASRPTV
jgi:hypothetical protein